MPEPSGLHYSNRLARYFFLAMEDVMGRSGLNVVLSLANLEHYVDHYPPDNLDCQFDFADLAALNIALEDMYGARGGRGMALRIGRACFSLGLKNFGAMSGVNDPAFRALPLDQRCLLGLKGLASIFDKFSDQRNTVEDQPQAYRYTIDNSPMAWKRSADKPVCHAQVGILQECLRWVSNGYEYYVVETACRAAGSESCVFSLNKTPIGQR